MTEDPGRDRTEIAELCVRMGWHLDHCEWDALTGLFTNEVRLDYSSLNGGEPVMVPRAEMVAKWRLNRTGLAATQHLVSNQLVQIAADRRSATATAMFQATHVLPNPYGGPIWTLGGKYAYGLARTDAGWRIQALAMSILWADGNRHIRDLAVSGDPS